MQANWKLYSILGKARKLPCLCQDEQNVRLGKCNISTAFSFVTHFQLLCVKAVKVAADATRYHDTRSCSSWPEKAGYTIVTALPTQSMSAAFDVSSIFSHCLLPHTALADSLPSLDRTCSSKSTFATWLQSGKYVSFYKHLYLHLVKLKLCWFAHN